MVLFHHDKAKTPRRKTPAQGRGFSNTATNGVFSAYQPAPSSAINRPLKA